MKKQHSIGTKLLGTLVIPAFFAAVLFSLCAANGKTMFATPINVNNFVLYAAIVMITVGLIKLSRKNRERRQEAIHQLLNGRDQGEDLRKLRRRDHRRNTCPGRHLDKEQHRLVVPVD